MTKINMKCIFDSVAQEGGLGIINKCMEWNLMQREMPCPKCNKLGFVMTLSRAREQADSFKWRCYNMRPTNKKKRKPCTYSLSLRSRTVFAHSRLSIWQVLCFFVLWVRNVPINVILVETEMSMATAIDMSIFCCKIAHDWLAKHNQKIGGTDKTIQVAHKNFGKKKEGPWVVGGIDASTGNCFMDVLEEVNNQTILPVIKQYVEIGSRIVSGSDVYDTLNDHGFHHIKINRKLNFVDPETGLHRNNILATINAFKSSLPTLGRRKEKFDNFALKYVFLKCCKSRKLDSFIELCNEIGSQFNTVNSEETETEMTEVTQDVSDVCVDKHQKGHSDKPNANSDETVTEMTEVTQDVSDVCVDKAQNGHSDKPNAETS